MQKKLLEAKDYEGNERIELLIIKKKNVRLYLDKDDKVQSIIPVSLGKKPIGYKKQRGDNRIAEGMSWIHKKLFSPKYYHSLCTSYTKKE